MYASEPRSASACQRLYVTRHCSGESRRRSAHAYARLRPSRSSSATRAYFPVSLAGTSPVFPFERGLRRTARTPSVVWGCFCYRLQWWEFAKLNDNAITSYNGFQKESLNYFKPVNRKVTARKLLGDLKQMGKLTLVREYNRAFSRWLL